jgi:hypothetical protein
MRHAHDLFLPNGLKLLLAATLLIPFFFAIVLFSVFPNNDVILTAAVTVVISYAAACVIDSVIQSRAIKIAIASIAALVSIILGSILVRSMTMVCDPVHDPGIVCDPVHIPEPATAAPTVITTVKPPSVTPMIFDPVHDPGSCSSDVCSVVSGTTTAIVAEKLDECKKKCGR